MELILQIGGITRLNMPPTGSAPVPQTGRAALAGGAIERKPEWFIQVFCSDEKLVQAALPLLHIYLYAFVFQALQYSAQLTFKALNKKGRAIFFSLFRKIIIIVPLAVLLPQYNGLGAKGVFIAEPVSNALGGTLVFLTMLLTLVPELRRLKPDMRSKSEKIPSGT